LCQTKWKCELEEPAWNACQENYSSKNRERSSVLRKNSHKSGYVNLMTRSTRQLLQILGAVLSVSGQARCVILLTTRPHYLNLLTSCSDRDYSFGFSTRGVDQLRRLRLNSQTAWWSRRWQPRKPSPQTALNLGFDSSLKSHFFILEAKMVKRSS